MSSTWNDWASIALACVGMLALVLLADTVRILLPPAWAIVRDVPSALFLALVADLTAAVPPAFPPPTVLAVIEADLPGKVLLAGPALAWSWRSCQPFLSDKGKRCAVQSAAALTAALSRIGCFWFALRAFCRDPDAFAADWAADMEARSSREAEMATLKDLARVERKEFERQESELRGLAKELGTLEANVHNRRRQLSLVREGGSPLLRERPHRERRFCPLPLQGLQGRQAPVATWYQTMWSGVDPVVVQLDHDIQVMRRTAKVRADSMEELRMERLQLLDEWDLLRQLEKSLKPKSSRPVTPEPKKPLLTPQFPKLWRARKPVVVAPAAPAAETHDAPCVQEPSVPDVPASSDVVDVPALLVSPTLAGPEMDAALAAPLFPATLAGEMEVCEPVVPQGEDEISGLVEALGALSLGPSVVSAQSAFAAVHALGTATSVALSTMGLGAGVASAQSAFAAAYAPATMTPVYPVAMDLDTDVVSEESALAAPHASEPMDLVADHHSPLADNSLDNGLPDQSSTMDWKSTGPASKAEDTPMPLAEPAHPDIDSTTGSAFPTAGPSAPAAAPAAAPKVAPVTPAPVVAHQQPGTAAKAPATGSAFATAGPSAPAPAPAAAPKVASVTPAPVAAQQQQPTPAPKKKPPTLVSVVFPSSKKGSSSSPAPKLPYGPGTPAGPHAGPSSQPGTSTPAPSYVISATGLTVPAPQTKQPAAVTSATGLTVPAPAAQEATPSEFATASAEAAWAKRGEEPTYAIGGVQRMEADFRQNIVPTLLKEPPYLFTKERIEFFQVTNRAVLKEEVESAITSVQPKISPAALATAIRKVAEKFWFSTLPNRVQLAQHMTAWWKNWMSQDIESEPDF